MKSFYNQQSERLYPIYGVSTLAEALEYAPDGLIIESDEKVYMNIETGSVDFTSGWEDADIENGSVVEVEFNAEYEQWEAA